METYLVRIQCLSPYLTPWRNCTLWGRLCWIIADGRLDGWDIETWLVMYEESSPPLVLGDGFPADAVPVPAIFQVTADGEEKPSKTLPWEDWLELCKVGKWSEKKNGKAAKTPQIERVHVVMDREKGSSVDGGLRTEIGWFPKEVVIVAQVDSNLSESGLKSLFEELCKEGWGQLRTAGYGQIRLNTIEQTTPPETSGYAVTLGHCHPTDDLPQEGYWRWTGVPVRPHSLHERKGPSQRFTTMLLPGSSFATNASFIGQTIPWNGRPDYRHYGLAPTWPIGKGA